MKKSFSGKKGDMLLGALIIALAAIEVLSNSGCCMPAKDSSIQKNFPQAASPCARSR